MKKWILPLCISVVLLTAASGVLLVLSNRHVYSEWTTVPSTCSQGGFSYRTCKLCGEIQYREKEPVLPHEYGEPVNQIRYETAYVECVRCGYRESCPYTPPEGIPRLYIEGTPAGVVIPVTFRYVDGTEEQTGYADIKIDASVERLKNKVNYDVTLFSDAGHTVPGMFVLRDTVGTVSAFTLKAEYYDLSGIRNLAASRLWEQVSASREEKDRKIADLPHGGADAGYPILFYTNGNFKGLYTLCLANEGSLFNMSGGGREMLLYTYPEFRRADFFVDMGDNFSVPVKVLLPEGEAVSAAEKSFGDCLDFISASDDASFIRRAEQYLDVDAAIDYLLCLYALGADDNRGLYCNWVTYNGKKWIPSMYNLTATFGMDSYGQSVSPDKTLLPSMEQEKVGSSTGVLLFDRLLQCFPDRVAQRYVFLREDILSDENVAAVMAEFSESIPPAVLEAEKEEYPDKQLLNAGSRAEELVTWFKQKTELLDGVFDRRTPADE